MKVITYVYYKWETTTPIGIVGTNPDRYMKNLRRIVDGGYFKYVTYAGQLNCTCGGMEKIGAHYGFIIQADKEMTIEILNAIEYDISESFNEETWEKLDAELRTMNERMINEESWEKLDAELRTMDERMINEAVKKYLDCIDEYLDWNALTEDAKKRLEEESKSKLMDYGILAD